MARVCIDDWPLFLADIQALKAYLFLSTLRRWPLAIDLAGVHGWPATPFEAHLSA